MALFVRVELNDTRTGDFGLLHATMDNQGFKRLIEGSNGNSYRLPRATYILNSSADKSEVLKMTEKAVSLIGRTAEILVVDYKSCTWSGLDLV